MKVVEGSNGTRPYKEFDHGLQSPLSLSLVLSYIESPVLFSRFIALQQVYYGNE
jgi:hypothetical protein